MKRILFFGLALTMSALLFTNCANEDWIPEPSDTEGEGNTTVVPEKKEVPFELTAAISQTKTQNDGTTIVWSADDSMNAFHAVSGTTTFIDDESIEVKDASKNLFGGMLAKALKDGYSYDWYVFYPYTEGLAIVENKATITLGAAAGSSQTQTGKDSQAHVAGPAMPMVGFAMGVEAEKTPAVQMNHLASVIEVVVTNVVSPPLTVSEVKVTANDDIVGEFSIDLSSSSLKIAPVTASKTAQLVVKDAGAIENTQSASFYLVVKPFSAAAHAPIKISVNGYEKTIELAEAVNFPAGGHGTLAFTYDNIDFEETLEGAYSIKNLWVYGGTGPEYNSTAYLKMQEKTWCFDEEGGHGITAEMDNYLEFKMVDIALAGDGETVLSTNGTCTNWAGLDGKNWSCWYNQTKVPWNKADITQFYRKIPVGHSTWVRDYTVEPNTVTFTDEAGSVTVLELLAPQTITPNDGSTRSLTLENQAFHVSFKNLGLKDHWTHAYDDLGRIYYKPRNYFIEVVKVDAVPEDAKTVEPVFVPTLPPDPNVVPTTVAGTYIHSYAYCNGGIDPAFVAFVDKSWAFNDSSAGNVYKMKDDIYVFTATGTDVNGNETGEIDFQPGADGEYWDMIYPAAKHKKDGLGDLDLSPFYGKIPHGKSTYVYDKSKLTITITNGDHTATANYLMPGEHTVSGKSHTVTATFALDFNLNYTTPNVPGYNQDWSDFERFYVAPWNYVLHLQKQ